MYIKPVFESINSIRHNDIVRKAIPRVYDMTTEKVLPQFVSRAGVKCEVQVCEVVKCEVWCKVGCDWSVASGSPRTLPNGN